ncbi:MAG: hypothetical protein ABFC71_04010 [Methanoregula sp.]
MKSCVTLVPAVLLILLIIAVPVSGAVVCTSPARCLTPQQAAEQFGAGNYVLTSRDVCGYLTDPTGARTAQYCYAPVATVVTTTVPLRIVPRTTQTTAGSGLIAPAVTTTEPTNVTTTVPVLTTLTTLPARTIATVTQTPAQPVKTTAPGVVPAAVPAGVTPLASNGTNSSAQGPAGPGQAQPDQGGLPGVYLVVGGLLGLGIIGGLAYHGLTKKPGELKGKAGFIDPASGGDIDPAGKEFGDGDGDFSGPGGNGMGHGGGFSGPGGKGLGDGGDFSGPGGSGIGHGGGFSGPGGVGPGDGGDFSGPGGSGIGHGGGFSGPGGIGPGDGGGFTTPGGSGPDDGTGFSGPGGIGPGDGGGFGGLGGSLSGLTLPEARDALINLWMTNGSFSQGMGTDPIGTLENLGLKFGDEEKGIIKKINWSGLNQKKMEDGGDDGGGDDGGGEGGDDGGGDGGDDGGGDDGGDGGDGGDDGGGDDGGDSGDGGNGGDDGGGDNGGGDGGEGGDGGNGGDGGEGGDVGGGGGGEIGGGGGVKDVNPAGADQKLIEKLLDMQKGSGGNSI